MPSPPHPCQKILFHQKSHFQQKMSTSKVYYWNFKGHHAICDNFPSNFLSHQRQIFDAMEYDWFEGKTSFPIIIMIKCFILKTSLLGIVPKRFGEIVNSLQQWIAYTKLYICLVRSTLEKNAVKTNYSRNKTVRSKPPAKASKLQKHAQ